MSLRFRADKGTPTRKGLTDVAASPEPNDILKAAVLSGVINAVINGAIQAYLLRGTGQVALSVDPISAGTHTVLSAAVPLAVSLAMILTAVAYQTVKVPKKPFWPTVVWLVVKHGLFAFGAIVAVAVVWQRIAGTVEVGTGTAVGLLGVLAGVVAGIVNYMTISAVILPKP